MKLEDIGFYTLSEIRARTSSTISPLQRCELLITDRCNFKCPYCRGTIHKGDMNPFIAMKILKLWVNEGLVNVRFTGGEPTLYSSLGELVYYCKENKVKRIALSTNGTADLDCYKHLISCGVNDFSISLDGGCCSTGNIMAGGIHGLWEKVVENIKYLSQLTYVTVGMVFTELNVNECVESVIFADTLGVADIRIIPSAQYNKALNMLVGLPEEIINKHPILKYRIQNIKNGIHVRGIRETDTNRCPLVLDDIAIGGKYHYPCVIYMREMGKPIGVIGENTRKEREIWFNTHDTKLDKICENNCLDVCREYNNKWMYYHKAVMNLETPKEEVKQVVY
jgi:MoaA/NifB/PqqE/SkfB family radical SAM enzyme